MDLATMIVVLLFKGGEAQHFVRAERDMGACMGALGGKTRLLTPATAETDYVYLSDLPAGFCETVFRSAGNHRDRPAERSLRGWRLSLIHI